MESLKPSQWLRKLLDEANFKSFPLNMFSKSCLIYFKRDYGIFILQSKDKVYYTVKVQLYSETAGMIDYNNQELLIGLYLKKFASGIPNLLHVQEIYLGKNPNSYPLFIRDPLQLSNCKNADLREIYPVNRRRDEVFSYYMMETCNYNLNYFLGVNKGTLTYETFLGYSFGLLVGLQTLHRLGVIHRDMKTANVLLCNSKIAKEYANIKYIYTSSASLSSNKLQKSWTIPYSVLNNMDIKIIDFGEAEIIDTDITNECQMFKNEISVALVEILNTMWKKVIDKDKAKENNYLILSNNLRNCHMDSTNTLVEIMFSPIFDIFRKEEENSYHVHLLPF